ncbi:hypothetical protein [Psychrobacter sp. I-STPA10]|uniref:hypothetical protein n=1 Tax=Psychrobacter sp. I-STPA10 TaxID=2585769 RepID=UPI001E299D44|nr:hypothetical protein [Psychrobacter sp. I-STPA10]
MKHTKKQFEDYKNKLKSINNYSAYNLIKTILEILCDCQIKSCSCNMFSEELEVYLYIEIDNYPINYINYSPKNIKTRIDALCNTKFSKISDFFMHIRDSLEDFLYLQSVNNCQDCCRQGGLLLTKIDQDDSILFTCPDCGYCESLNGEKLNKKIRSVNMPPTINEIENLGINLHDIANNFIQFDNI